MSFGHNHIWRNFGIICAWWVLFISLTIFFTNGWKQIGDGGRNLYSSRTTPQVQAPFSTPGR
jgi:hypothetical protein